MFSARFAIALLLPFAIGIPSALALTQSSFSDTCKAGYLYSISASATGVAVKEIQAVDCVSRDADGRLVNRYTKACRDKVGYLLWGCKTTGKERTCSRKLCQAGESISAAKLKILLSNVNPIPQSNVPLTGDVPELPPIYGQTLLSTSPAAPETQAPTPPVNTYDDLIYGKSSGELVSDTGRSATESMLSAERLSGQKVELTGGVPSDLNSQTVKTSDVPVRTAPATFITPQSPPAETFTQEEGVVSKALRGTSDFIKQGLDVQTYLGGIDMTGRSQAEIEALGRARTSNIFQLGGGWASDVLNRTRMLAADWGLTTLTPQEQAQQAVSPRTGTDMALNAGALYFELGAPGLGKLYDTAIGRSLGLEGTIVRDSEAVNMGGSANPAVPSVTSAPSAPLTATPSAVPLAADIAPAAPEAIAAGAPSALGPEIGGLSPLDVAAHSLTPPNVSAAVEVISKGVPGTLGPDVGALSAAESAARAWVPPPAVFHPELWATRAGGAGAAFCVYFGCNTAPEIPQDRPIEQQPEAQQIPRQQEAVPVDISVLPSANTSPKIGRENASPGAQAPAQMQATEPLSNPTAQPAPSEQVPAAAPTNPPATSGLDLPQSPAGTIPPAGAPVTTNTQTQNEPSRPSAAQPTSQSLLISDRIPWSQEFEETIRRADRVMIRNHYTPFHTPATGGGKGAGVDYGGIGVRSNHDPLYVGGTMYSGAVVTSVFYPGSPAAQAGIQIGDFLISANSKPFWSVSTGISGDPGTNVAITYIPRGGTTPRTVTIRRALIQCSVYGCP